MYVRDVVLSIVTQNLVTCYVQIIPNNTLPVRNVRFRFASCAQGMISGVPLIRLVREMCQRVRTWSVLSGKFRNKAYKNTHPTLGFRSSFGPFRARKKYL